MEWQVIVALIMAVPVVLFPVAVLWYLNVDGIYAAFKEAKSRRATRDQGNKVPIGGRIF
jgi:hypothetical protein